MEELLSLIVEGEGQDLQKAITELRVHEKDSKLIDNHRKEVYELNRKLRTTQLDNIILDKTIKKDNGSKIVKKVRVPIPFAKKIITTSTAFEFGKPVTIKFENEEQLSKELLSNWKYLRMDSKLQRLSINKKTETESCIIFYITNGENRKMKCKVLNSSDGKMIPYFNEDEDMTFFLWIFTEKDGDKSITNYWIYDKDKIYQIKETENSYELIDEVEHGFDKIPVVYVSQDEVEYFDVKQMIDRYEVAISKLGNSNDYTGHPMLFLKGKVEGMPEKDDDGKLLAAPITIDSDGKEHSGDAKFLTHDNAPESVRMELDTLENLIYSMTSTPDVSFSNLKGIGNIASHSMELMFLDAKLKAYLNEGDNRTTVQRCINVILSGIVTTLKTSSKSQLENLKYDIEFNSVLPNNLQEMIETMSQGVVGKVLSTETAVKTLKLTSNNQKEIDNIKDENDQKSLKTEG
ncbi:phage portal protein [Aquimarina sp. 2201CG5-10]|uniref:phage portal protein n=1 Tax=Aquimarina callyspongiae TaxID=3098150 RepID=UPI002AB51632|nr:phage portal protein [Aquimarina sp. 2201CG5-10]MDY8137569.1 phage portal protein [Aquimarina sp. 2201CG5-10]